MTEKTIFHADNPPNWCPRMAVFACKNCQTNGLVVAVGLHPAAWRLFLTNRGLMECPVCAFTSQFQSTKKGKIVDRLWLHCHQGLRDWKQLDGLEIIKEPEFDVNEVSSGVLDFTEGDYPLLVRA